MSQNNGSEIGCALQLLGAARTRVRAIKAAVTALETDLASAIVTLQNANAPRLFDCAVPPQNAQPRVE